MTAITPDECRELAERLGIQPQYASGNCQNCGVYCTGQSIFCTPPIFCYPNFLDPRVVLREMEKYPKFEESLFSITEIEYHSYNPERRIIIFDKFLHLVKDETGLLAKAALEWLRKERENGER